MKKCCQGKSTEEHKTRQKCETTVWTETECLHGCDPCSSACSWWARTCKLLAGPTTKKITILLRQKNTYSYWIQIFFNIRIKIQQQ